ncbi:MAG: ArgR family transcriptional regulator [Oscillospiraceae bacterium]|nr:ArgR family transcriptional regulator [Oscillospiraceae bacterium]
MPNARHELILHLIETQDVTTQEMLRSLLAEKGFHVTQATISRDIHILNLQKKRKAAGLSCYVRSNTAPVLTNNLMTDVVNKIEAAMHTVVVSCQPGTAQAACAVLDRLNIPEIVGTIAGDDTIFIVTRSEESAKQVVSLLESRIWG